MENDPTSTKPKHAVLGPSGASRWISCPASVRVIASIPARPESPYAHEGTAAHALGEIRAHCEIEAWQKRYRIDDDTYAEMTGYINGYLDLIRERLAAYPNSQLLIEQRVDTGVPSCWGTADVVIVSPKHVEIIDLKYGMGVEVDAEDNPQLRLYGIGALESFGELMGEPEIVIMTIYQPRVNNVSFSIMPVEDLRAWRDSIIPIAVQALESDDAPFGPSEEACRWCDARGLCKAQRDFSLRQDFGPVDVMDEDELGEVLDQIDGIEAWCAAVREMALDAAYSQRKQIPGYKVVRGNGRRFVTDEEEAIKILRGEGYRVKDVVKPQTLVGIGELEKLLGKDRLPIVLGAVIDKSEGKPALVKESDRRRAIDPAGDAAEEFAEHVEE
jgi:hypothetical protein